MARAADDILQLIFEAVVGPALLPWPATRYDRERALAPFVLAAVCRYWRIITHSTPTLWTYFGFPRSPTNHTAHYERLQIQVVLVKQVPIHVVFSCNDRSPPSYYRADTNRIFDTLIKLGSQWGSGELNVAETAVSRFYAGQPQEWTCLEQLSLTCNIGRFRIPRAPQLKRLHLDCHTMDKDFTDLPSLSVFSCYSADNAATKDICCSYAAQLVELYILDDLYDHSFERLHFPSLKTLVLDDANFLPYVDAPNLRTLTIQANSLAAEHAKFAVHYACVQHLILYGLLESNVVDVLRHFNSISKITFEAPDVILKAFSHRKMKLAIADGFFTELLNGQSRPAWPLLEHICIPPGYGYVDFEGFIAFVESRTRHHEGASKQSQENKPRMLKRVEIENEPNLPKWILPALKLLLPSSPAPPRYPWEGTPNIQIAPL
ncbi:hypothetical protein BKA62DRAFT_704323 [Auriculariales sp. MPI-PUGE-AT-0066]|nr:hypothetical protein BKA62DRAFT_704323 [Auriculariales sp. MPI-PUGE-AT-0066]